jgi:hypothetical protein
MEVNKWRILLMINWLASVRAEAELDNDLDPWLYILKNMSSLKGLSIYLQKPIFEKLFQIAEYSKRNQEEREMYKFNILGFFSLTKETI